MRIKLASLLVIVCCTAATARAHHSSAAAASGNRAMLTSGLRTKPLSHAYAFYEFVRMDGSVGERHVMTIGGEYSFTKSMSAGLSLPLEGLVHRFRADAFGPGDLSLIGKALLWDSRSTFAFAATALSLPTGDESKALGRGALGQETSAFLGLKLGQFSLYGALGAGFGYEAASEPILTISAGATAPRFFNERAEVGIGLASQVFIASDALRSGSTKSYLQPQISVFLDGRERWQANLAGQLSVIDTLRPKPRRVIVNTDPTLLNDALYGITIGVDFNFK